MYKYNKPQSNYNVSHAHDKELEKKKSTDIQTNALTEKIGH